MQRVFDVESIEEEAISADTRHQRLLKPQLVWLISLEEVVRVDYILVGLGVVIPGQLGSHAAVESEDLQPAERRRMTPPTTAPWPTPSRPAQSCPSPVAQISTAVTT
jgi:hypothetical protein